MVWSERTLPVASSCFLPGRWVLLLGAFWATPMADEENGCYDIMGFAYEDETY
jgi:hypothetical protein